MGLMKMCRIRKPGICLGLQMTLVTLLIASLSYLLLSLFLVG
jgi:hypothetical protein